MTEHRKQCEGACPRCGSTKNIEWNDKEWDNDSFSCVGYQQVGFCPACDLAFTEYASYKETVWDDEKEN